MGLDMYLKRKIYVKKWDHTPKEKLVEITVNQGGKPMESVNTEKISYIEEEAAYWRKANHIHKWFVDTVQNGEDDCGEYYVSKDQLQELVSLCQRLVKELVLEDGQVKNGERMTEKGWEPIMQPGKVVKNPELAHELLPTAEGFFFGGTNYDGWYVSDLQSTIDQIKPYLEMENDPGDYYYHSSW